MIDRKKSNYYVHRLLSRSYNIYINKVNYNNKQGYNSEVQRYLGYIRNNIQEIISYLKYN